MMKKRMSLAEFLIYAQEEGCSLTNDVTGEVYDIKLVKREPPSLNEEDTRWLEEKLKG